MSAYCVVKYAYKFSVHMIRSENCDQNPRIENTETFLSQVYFILTENVLQLLFSQKQLILVENFL